MLDLDLYIEQKRNVVDYYKKKVDTEIKIGHSISLPTDRLMLENESIKLRWLEELRARREADSDNSKI